MLKRHSSTYPIDNGNIIRVYKRDERHNPKLGYVAPHKFYIWIQRYGELEVHRPGKDRKIHVVYFHVPHLPGDLKQEIIQKSTVIRKVNLIQLHLRGNDIEVVGNVIWNHTDGALRRALRTMGLNYYTKR